MKNLILVLLLLLGCNLIRGQQTIRPSDINQGISSSQSLTLQNTKNYIRAYTYRDDSNPSDGNVYDVSIDIRYYDGFGRPSEKVQVKASPAGNDIVMLQTYDAHGRENKSYLPYAKTTSGGSFVSESAVTSALPTYLSSNYDLIGSDASYGYSKPKYELSSLNRLLQKGAPGAEWQPGTSSTLHPVKYNYRLNTSSLLLWRYKGDSYTTRTYNAGNLFITETVDEDGKPTRIYTDLQGKKVMEEAFDGINWLQTRYCYDNFNLLRCVLQPMATSPANSEYCFYYKYDVKRRMTDKKVPGSDWVYMVYDARDRLVLTQDGNARATNKWNYTAYDVLDRPIRNSYFITSASRATLETYYESNNTPYATEKAIEHMVYDTHPASLYSAFPFEANSLVDSSSLAASHKGLLVAKQAKKDLNSTFPVLQVSMYYYDKYERLIQSVETYFLDPRSITSYTRTSYKYNFSGQVIEKWIEYKEIPNIPFTVKVFYEYDHRGRLIQTEYQVDGTQPAIVPRTIVSAAVYNEAGLLKTKYLHSVTASNAPFMQKIDYRYNIRGWLTRINDVSLLTGEGDKFGLKIGYNRLPVGSGNGCWNGNISGVQWGSPFDVNLGFTYTYDSANRLKNAVFNDAGTSNGRFNIHYGYNKNGNLTSALRYANNSNQPIDQITYGYEASSNRLYYAKDTYGDVAGVEDFPGTLSTTQNFSYDSNGNLIWDNYRSV
ncbi:DUF6443 domain-containing protein, partial [Mariniphaga sediminis]|uniref:DUF6443 domain-containing protein n=1 Tax=Mariniphaga sediminis TaxID=1628158 RepID=UPI0035674931